MTLEELRKRQSWTLAQKIDHSLGVIDQYTNRYDGNVYLAYSGGKRQYRNDAPVRDYQERYTLCVC